MAITLVSSLFLHGGVVQLFGNLIYLCILAVALVLTLWMSWRILRTVYSHEPGLDEPDEAPTSAPGASKHKFPRLTCSASAWRWTA